MKSAQELKELIGKDTASLYKETEVLNQKLVSLRFDASFRKLKNLKSIQQTRKRIARVWTIINSRVTEELEQSPKEQKEKVAK